MGKRMTTRDETNLSDYRFTELFDLPEIQKLQDLFSAATGVASLITEPDGTPITEPSGFCDLCLEIRKTEKGLENCLLSDSILGSPQNDSPKIQRCLSGGLLDGGASILVGGKHLASWLVGQVIDENYSIDELLAYAEVIGVTPEVCRREFYKVKRMSKLQFENVCNFLFLNAQQLSKYALKNIALTMEINRKISAEKEINKINRDLELIVKHRTSQLEESNAELEETNALLEESNAELEESNAELEESNLMLVEEIAKRQAIEKDIIKLNEELENKVLERTNQLQDINTILKEEIIEKTRVENELNKERIFTDALFNSVPGMIYLYDDQSRLVRWNTKHEEMTGYTTDELNGMNLLNWYPGDEKSQSNVIEGISRANQNGFGEAEASLQTKIGTKIPMYFTASPVMIEGKRYFAGLGIDITERKQIEEDLKASEERFRTMFEQAPLGIALSDSKTGHIFHANPRFTEITGRTDEELIKMDWMSLMHPEDRREYLANIALLKDEKISGLKMNLRYLLPDASIAWIKMTVSPIKDKDIEHPRHLCMIEDITESKLLNERLEKYQVLAKKTNDAMMFVDKAGNIVEVNDAALGIYGYTYEEFLSLNILAIRRRESSTYIFEQMATADKEGIIFETVHFRKDGSSFPVEVSSQGTNLGTDRVILSIVRDITDRKKKEEENSYLCYHDVLTGLYNRRFYEEEIKRLDTARNLPVSIIMGDVNGLKLVNDAFGHLAGDQLLQKASGAIRKACRTEDIVARWGGDEFVILLPKTNNDEAEEIVNRIKELCSNEFVNAIRISISFGWDTKTKKTEDVLAVLKNAEDFMYKNKIIENEGLRGNAINTIIKTLHEKNPREEQHSQRVSELCQLIGTAMGFSELEVSKLKIVGLLHDIGKIAIDEGILNKPGKLNESERNDIQRHPEIGYRILSSSYNMLDIAECILAHHERWDGMGYPKGLKGEEIPRVARIIALADSYDAMTSARLYQNPLSLEEVITEIRNNLDTQFDPAIGKLFIEKVLVEKRDPTKIVT